VSSISLMLPIKTISEQNWRGHWAVKARRAKQQRRSAYLLALSIRKLMPKTGKITVKLTRIGSRLLDTDGLSSSQKAVRDGIADALQEDDSPGSRIVWEYGQEKGPRGQYAVRMEVRI